jgi:hypothetical protein
MNQPTFKYVEDYIEFIGGRRAIDGKMFGIFNYAPPPISLARYDVSIIESLSNQTCELKNPYTDKQSALAIKLVDKYRRQLSNLKIPVIVPEKLEEFRLGIRIVDRTKSVYIEDNQFVVKFPYETKLIDLLKKQSRQGEGSVRFDYDRKIWILGMTEYNLNWIMTICPQNGFSIHESVTSLYEKLLSVESNEYKICLRLIDNRLTLENAESSLLEYVENIGGVLMTNLLRLIDVSAVLGFTVDENLVEYVTGVDNEHHRKFLMNRKTFCNKEKISMEQVLEYARKVNRLPIHVYENGLPKNDTEEIIYLNRGVGPEVCPKLLVTTTSLMIGSKKQSWLSNAEKIIIIE